MAKKKTFVQIAADTLETVCPYHGPQPGAEYAPVAAAPCGCKWYLSEDDGLLHAVKADAEAQERAELLRLQAT